MPHLDLGSVRAMATFMEDHIDLLPIAEQKTYREMIDRVKKKERMPKTELARSAKALAEALWPIRHGGDANDAAQELKEMQKRFEALREQAARSIPAQQDLLLLKLAAFEDRVYFGAETIPLEILDAELAYDIADREVPPSEEPML